MSSYLYLILYTFLLLSEPELYKFDLNPIEHLWGHLKTEKA